MELLTGLGKFLQEAGPIAVAVLALVAALTLWRSLKDLQKEMMGMLKAHTAAMVGVEKALEQVKDVVSKGRETQEAMIRSLAFAETANKALDKLQGVLATQSKDIGVLLERSGPARPDGAPKP